VAVGRRGYRPEIRAFAITERHEGKPWKQIAEDIRVKYGVCPSIRQMQKWFFDGAKSLGSGAALLTMRFEEFARELAPMYYLEVLRALPYLDQNQFLAFLSFMERKIGRERFDEVYRKYMEVRDIYHGIKQRKGGGSDTNK
jgi:hypothetical protein